MNSLLHKVLKSKFDFSDEEIYSFLDFLTVKEIKKNDCFLKRGQIPKEFAFVEKGSFVYLKGELEDNVAIDFAFEDSWIADLNSYNSNLPTDLNILALEDSLIYSLACSDMEILLKQNMKILMIKNFYVESAFASVSQHERRVITFEAKERYMDLMQVQPQLLQRVPLYLLASYLGIKPQSLSRIRSEIGRKF